MIRRIQGFRNAKSGVNERLPTRTSTVSSPTARSLRRHQNAPLPVVTYIDGSNLRGPVGVTGCREDGLPATDGLPLTADASLQRSELEKSAMRGHMRLTYAEPSFLIWIVGIWRHMPILLKMKKRRARI